MRNLNEPRRTDEEEITTADIARKPGTQQEADVIPFERRSAGLDMEAPRPVLTTGEMEDLRSRWNAIQTNFVDEPRNAVEEADKLVASAIKRIAETFSDERTKLEDQWSRGSEVSTEDLRLALQRYRGFFARLLSI